MKPIVLLCFKANNNVNWTLTCCSPPGCLAKEFLHIFLLTCMRLRILLQLEIRTSPFLITKIFDIQLTPSLCLYLALGTETLVNKRVPMHSALPYGKRRTRCEMRHVRLRELRRHEQSKLRHPDGNFTLCSTAFVDWNEGPLWSASAPRFLCCGTVVYSSHALHIRLDATLRIILLLKRGHGLNCTPSNAKTF